VQLPDLLADILWVILPWRDRLLGIDDEVASIVAQHMTLQCTGRGLEGN
jgi:hypothetical protein